VSTVSSVYEGRSRTCYYTIFVSFVFFSQYLVLTYTPSYVVMFFLTKPYYWDSNSRGEKKRGDKTKGFHGELGGNAL
jgi:hypothetical protein